MRNILHRIRRRLNYELNIIINKNNIDNDVGLSCMLCIFNNHMPFYNIKCTLFLIKQVIYDSFTTNHKNHLKGSDSFWAFLLLLILPPRFIAFRFMLWLLCCFMLFMIDFYLERYLHIGELCSLVVLGDIWWFVGKVC